MAEMSEIFDPNCCQIVRADCMEVLPTLDTASFDALITDPPYSSGGQYRGDRMQNASNKYSVAGTKAEYIKHEFEGDNMDQRAFTSWAAHWLALCRRAVKPGGVAAIFIDWRQLAALYDAIQWGGWILRGIIPWDKTNGRPHPGRPRQQCEFIVWASNGPLSIKRSAPHMPGLLTCSPPAARSRTHQTEKPLKLMRQLVHICEDGGRIIDPFAGSGTTICAAALEGFTGLGLERNEYHARIAQDRLAKTVKEVEGQMIDGAGASNDWLGAAAGHTPVDREGTKPQPVENNCGHPH